MNAVPTAPKRMQVPGNHRTHEIQSKVRHEPFYRVRMSVPTATEAEAVAAVFRESFPHYQWRVNGPLG